MEATSFLAASFLTGLDRGSGFALGPGLLMGLAAAFGLAVSFAGAEFGALAVAAFLVELAETSFEVSFLGVFEAALDELDAAAAEAVLLRIAPCLPAVAVFACPLPMVFMTVLAIQS